MTYVEKLEHIKSLAESLGLKILVDEPLSKHTTFKVGGKCDLMVYPDSVESLSKLYCGCKESDLYTYILGNGSNILFTDDGFRGVVIVLSSDFSDISVDGERLNVLSGTMLSKLCKTALEHSLTGLEFAYGIPGSVGGAVYMNAGAYGGEMKDVIESVTALSPDGKLLTFTNQDLDFSYRHSIFSRSDMVIISAVYKLEKGNAEDIKSKMDDLMSRRVSKQPLEFPSAGSTFKRPEGTYAGLVIEQSGLKGYTVGGAQVSEKHANFVINKGGATASDIINLISDVKKTVKEKTGYTLECEVEVIAPQL